MKILLIGCGTIGETILKQLSNKEHTITIVDTDKNKIQHLIEKYDVNGIIGNGASIDILNEADIKNHDLLIATSSSDEINILACLMAKKLGCEETIARVRNPEYFNQSSLIKDGLGISMIVNPDLDTAREILNMINLPSIAKIETFAMGKVTLVEILIDKNNPLIGETLISINKKLKTKVLICAIQRGQKVIIPDGNFKIARGDRIHFTADTSSLNSFLLELDLIKTPLKNIMIIGGNRMAYYLSKELSSKKYNVKLIEQRKQRAEELATLLPKATVICGDGTDHDLLLEEGIENMDSVVSLTNVDEENIIVSMYANKLNVKKTISKIQKDGLVGIIGELDILNPVSPKYIIANKIVSYVRALSNRRGSNVTTLYKLVDEEVEALEFIAKQDNEIYNKPLRDLKFKNNCLVACIIRKNEVIIPDGNSNIQKNDNVVVVTTHKGFDDLNDIIA